MTRHLRALDGPGLSLGNASDMLLQIFLCSEGAHFSYFWIVRSSTPPCSTDCQELCLWVGHRPLIKKVTDSTQALSAALPSTEESGHKWWTCQRQRGQ